MQFSSLFLVLALAGLAFAATHSLSVHNGQDGAELSRDTHTWSMYDFVDVEFQGFERDTSVSVTIEDAFGNSIGLTEVPVAQGVAHVPVAKMMPSEGATLTVVGEQSGDVGVQTQVTIEIPNMEFQQEAFARFNN